MARSTRSNLSPAALVRLAAALGFPMAAVMFSPDTARAGTSSFVVEERASPPSDGDEIFGDITDGAPEFGAEEPARRNASPAWRKAFALSKKQHCVEGRARFSFVWEGDVEQFSCGDVSQSCYFESKVILPGSRWKCGARTCTCQPSGDVISK